MAYAANFEIYRVDPIYCQITDGHIGSRFVKLPMTYSNAKLAHKLATRLEQQDYDSHGDSSFRVVKLGDSPLQYRHYDPYAGSIDDEIPF